MVLAIASTVLTLACRRQVSTPGGVRFTPLWGICPYADYASCSLAQIKPQIFMPKPLRPVRPSCYGYTMTITECMWEAASADAVEAAEAVEISEDDWAWYIEATYVDPAERVW